MFEIHKHDRLEAYPTPVLAGFSAASAGPAVKQWKPVLRTPDTRGLHHADIPKQAFAIPPLQPDLAPDRRLHSNAVAFGLPLNEDAHAVRACCTFGFFGLRGGQQTVDVVQAVRSTAFRRPDAAYVFQTYFPPEGGTTNNETRLTICIQENPDTGKPLLCGVEVVAR
jgi:hypothetical protein